jgi:hypothetical protein
MAVDVTAGWWLEAVTRAVGVGCRRWWGAIGSSCWPKMMVRVIGYEHGRRWSKVVDACLAAQGWLRCRRKVLVAPLVGCRWGHERGGAPYWKLSWY